MTIRGGGKPRRFVGRAPGVDPDGHRIVDPDLEGAYASDAAAETDDERLAAYEPRYLRTRRRRGTRQLIQFAIFAVVLCGLVVGGLVFVARPLAMRAIVDWAAENQTALSMPLVSGIVRGELADALDAPAGTDPAPITFLVNSGQTPRQIADGLLAAGLLKDAEARRAFVFDAIDKDVTSSFMAGKHVLNKTMTPDQIVAALQLPPPADPLVKITFREGLRIEQLVAKLESVEASPTDPQHPLKLDVQEFHKLATNPPATLTSKYAWLKQGVSLEGFLFPATYEIAPDATPDVLISKMLAAFAANAPADLLKLPPDDVYKKVTLASLVEAEAKIDADRPLIAGVYTNRLDPKLWKTGLLNADPTLIYANDSMWLTSHPIADWVTYSFGNPVGGDLNKFTVPATLSGYQTYQHAGLPPTPINSPSTASIQAALQPDTKDKFLFFLLVPDSGGKHVFAKTQAEHNANLVKYGYR